MTMTVLVPSDVTSDEGHAARADIDNVSLVVYDPDPPNSGPA
jgi:hypothetical protein